MSLKLHTLDLLSSYGVKGCGLIVTAVVLYNLHI